MRVRAGSARSSRRDRRGDAVVTLAAACDRAMLGQRVGIAALGAASTSSTSLGWMAPLQTLLTEGHAHRRGGGSNETERPEDIEALADQTLRTSSRLGVPDLEVHRHPGGIR